MEQCIASDDLPGPLKQVIEARTGSIACQVENFTDFGHSPGCTRGCWATRPGRSSLATRSGPKLTCCTIRSSGRSRPIPATSRS